MHAWKAYIKMLEPKIGEVTYASWRNKFDYGWHDSWLMGIDGINTSRPIDWHDSYNILIREKKTFIQSNFAFSLFIRYSSAVSKLNGALVEQVSLPYGGTFVQV